MNFKEKYPGLDDDNKFVKDDDDSRSIILNDYVRINTLELDKTRNNYLMELWTIGNKDDERIIRNIITISLGVTRNNEIKIPVTLRIEPRVIDYKDLYKESITYALISDCLLISRNDSDIEIADTINDKSKEDIFYAIMCYLNSYEELQHDLNFQQGIRKLVPTLKVMIDKMLESMKDFDIEENIIKQNELLHKAKYQEISEMIEERISYLNKVKEYKKQK